MSDNADRLIEVGRINGPYGVRGWVRITSYTEPEENILTYHPWLVADGDNSRKMIARNGRRHGKGLVAQFNGVDDRSQAAKLAGSAIRIMRSQLPAADDDNFYWTDLAGLEVRTTDGQKLGNVERVIATGANDVLIVQGERERLIPFVRPDTVREVDLDGGTIVVDWDPDF